MSSFAGKHVLIFDGEHFSLDPLYDISGGGRFRKTRFSICQGKVAVSVVIGIDEIKQTMSWMKGLAFQTETVYKQRVSEKLFADEVEKRVDAWAKELGTESKK
jgi:hypothetical protein